LLKTVYYGNKDSSNCIDIWQVSDMCNKEQNLDLVVLRHKLFNAHRLLNSSLVNTCRKSYSIPNM